MVFSFALSHFHPKKEIEKKRQNIMILAAIIILNFSGHLERRKVQKKLTKQKYLISCHCRTRKIDANKSLKEFLEKSLKLLDKWL